MKLGIKYSSRSLGGHTTQYRKLCLEAGIEPINSIKPIITPTKGKPCRYKACKGRNHTHHNEKCPIASARGKTGGKNGQGDSKKRLGETNGRFRDIRPCGCPLRKHKITCKLSRPQSILFNPNITINTKLKHEINIQTKKILNYSWKSQAISISSLPVNFLRSLDGVCSGCNCQIKAHLAAKVHRVDVNTQNPVRIICNACEA